MKGAIFMARATEENKQLWKFRLSEFESSSLSLKDWCNKKDIPVSTISYWRRKFNKEQYTESAPCWLKVSTIETDSSIADLQMRQETVAAVKPVITVKHGDFAVELPFGCGSQQIFEILQVLKAV